MLIQLFLSFIQIGALSFGGGMAALPLISEQVVAKHGWLSLNEFADLITISQMTPGPIAINAATFVGLQVGGFIGAIVATVGCVLPACVLVSILTYLYNKYGNSKYINATLGGLRPAVVALIASAGISIFKLAIWNGKDILLNTTNWIALALFALAFFIIRKWKINPILIMLLCGVLGGVIYTITAYPI